MDKKDEIILQQLDVIRSMTHAPVPGGKARGEGGPQDP